MKARMRCNIESCPEVVTVPSRVGFRYWEPCEPGEESGYCERHAPRELSGEDEAKAREALRAVLSHLAAMRDDLG